MTITLEPWRDSLAHSPEPGFYRTTFSEYLSVFAMSRTVLFEMLKSPAHARRKMQGPPEFTEALDFGEAAHLVVLQPEIAAGRIRVAEQGVTRKRWKAWRPVEAAARERDQVPVTLDEARRIMGIRQRIRQDKALSGLFVSPLREITMIWQDQETLVMCKGRVDLIDDDGAAPFLLDLKTTKDADRRKFAYTCRDYGYTLQSGMYSEGADALLGRGYMKGFLVVAAEKEEPYRTEAYDMRRHVAKGREQFRALLDRYAACAKANDFPATQALPESLIQELPLL